MFSDYKPQLNYSRSRLGDGDYDTSYSVATRRIHAHRPPSFNAFSNARLRSLRFGQSESLDWEEDEVVGPDVENREVLLTLAKMSNNAYLEPDENGWYDLGGNWSSVRLSLILQSTTQTVDRHTLLAGNRIPTASEAKCLLRLITRRSFSASRARRQASLEVEVRQSRKTNSTTTCFSAAAVLA